MTMLMIVPIMMSQSSPTRCPSCSKREKTKTVCAHCDYEYVEDEENESVFWLVIGTITFILFSVYLILTIMTWLIEGIPLFQVFRDQWEWITSLRIPWEWLKSIRIR